MMVDKVNELGNLIISGAQFHSDSADLGVNTAEFQEWAVEAAILRLNLGHKTVFE